MSNLYGKPQSKKIDWEKLKPYFPKKQLDHNGNEIPWSDDPATIAWLVNSAHNAMQAEKEHKLYEKQHKEELRLMEEREKREREETKRQQEINAKAPELQFNNLLAGKYPRYLFGNYY
jgi:hypothetical protein